MKIKQLHLITFKIKISITKLSSYLDARKTGFIWEIYWINPEYILGKNRLMWIGNKLCESQKQKEAYDKETPHRLMRDDSKKSQRKLFKWTHPQRHKYADKTVLMTEERKRQKFL